ncbi:hypothetical protein LG943_10325 [Streptomonospora sp. S1-112]|uniref:Uncharacterized protein n=1 Tax=Streptomonospora mangrovi TaxID=2883123 RepID=A0A9X3SFG1_9ACTN|nr:hypothetical protein [Streptomonospora mangrovi]MDA0564720.1 hypothetical protein [Streptomonospora mangrovi]
MSTRSPIATWTWLLNHDLDADGLEVGAPVGLTAVEVLREHRLLRVEYIDVSWHRDGGGLLWFQTRIHGPRLTDAGELAADVADMRPSGYPGARPARLDMRGTGFWVSASGTEREEPDIVSVSVDVSSPSVGLTVGVHHDVWSDLDFTGRPHPEVRQRNAPRLEQALRGLESALGSRLDFNDPDEATAYAEPVGYGVELLTDPEE